MSEKRHHKKLLKRMIFIYTALLSGWQIKHLHGKKFEFTRPNTVMNVNAN